MEVYIPLFVTQPDITSAIFPEHRLMPALPWPPLWWRSRAWFVGVLLANAALAQTNPCNPAFYPTDPNLQRQYHVLGGNQTYLQTFATTGNTLTEIRKYPDHTEQTPWICSDQGLSTLPEGEQSIPGGSVRLTKLTGVIIPSDETWKVGKSWVYRYELKGKIALFDLSGFLEVTNRVVAKETVEVPAGKFEALRIEASFQGQFGMGFGGKATYWFAQGVGVVKQLSEGSFGGQSLELVELKRG